MKSCLMIVILITFSLAAFASSTSQQSSSPEFTKFWSKFRAAVLKNDKETVASMTKLPFELSNKPLDKSAFIKSYPKLFDRKIRKCFQTEKPAKQDEGYSLFCGPNGDQGLYFEKVNDDWKFIAFFYAD